MGQDRSAATPNDLAAVICARIEQGLGDAEVRSAQFGLNERISLRIGEVAVGLVPSQEGYRLTRHVPDGASLGIATTIETWRRALEKAPPPGFQSMTAMRRSGRLDVEGDAAAWARSLHLLERLLEVLRPNADERTAPAIERDMRQIVGGYHSLTLPSGEQATIYAESAGNGVPLVCLHTAGADSRQWHPLLADVALAGRCRTWAFDLPMHGRSMPQERWDGGRVPLTQAAYQAWCARFIESVVGEPAVVVGCSMGAAMALVMAAERPELVRGVVAVEAPFRAQGRLNPFLAHAAVNSAAHNPSYVRGLMSPLVSMGARRAAAWIYGQGALGVYAGDLAFYEEFDGGAVGPRIDARRTPVAFLAGAYDYSATPEDARRLAALIPGSSLEVMPELGHFPMVECPDLFRTYFVPALDGVVAAAARGSA